MYYERRQRKNGQIYYAFSCIDETGKRRRLSRQHVPANIQTDAQADAFCRQEAARLGAKRDEIARKHAWRTQFYDFAELLDLFSRWQAQRAPNSYKSCVGYLDLWVLPFFLGEKQAGNVNSWHLHFRDFLDWLQTEAAVAKRGRKAKLANSTINNIIKALNVFLTCLVQYNKMDPAAARKCPALPEHLLNIRGHEAVIMPDERDRLAAALRAKNPAAGEFFLVLWHTGMRFAECFGLPHTALFRGHVPDAALHQELVKNNIEYVGYLYLESQPAHDDIQRDPATGRVARKPLKGSRVIGPKHARIIPIRDKAIWNILARRFLAAQSAHAARDFISTDKQDYLMWPDLEWNRLYAAWNIAAPGRRFHDCRHTFVTLLVGETRSSFLARAITGHRSQRAFERYLHIYERIALAAKQNEQVIEMLDLDA